MNRSVLGALFVPILITALFSCGSTPAPSAETSSVREQRNKETVSSFTADFYGKHDVSVAATYVSEQLIQHDPLIADGRQALVVAASASFAAFPESTLEVKRVYTSGDIVIVHALRKNTAADPGQAVVDIYAVDNNQIIEHWNVSQTVPAKVANTNTMFSPPDGRVPSDEIQKELTNKKIIRTFDTAFFNKKDLSAADQYVDEGYIQHNPTFATGRKGLVDGVTGFFTAFPNLAHDIKHIYTDGDFVILHTLLHIVPGDTGVAIVDIYRLENGKAVEHWDVLQPVPTTSANVNTMF